MGLHVAKCVCADAKLRSALELRSALRDVRFGGAHGNTIDPHCFIKPNGSSYSLVK